MVDTIRICPEHLDRPTPLISTLAFNGAERWCPHCGYKGSIFDGKAVDETEQLQMLAAADEARTQEYLFAQGCRVAARVKHNGEWIEPSALPADVKERHAKLIAEWSYKYSMTRDDWLAACQKRYVEQSNTDPEVALGFAQACAEQEQEDHGDEVHLWGDPADAADSDMSYWEDDAA